MRRLAIALLLAASALAFTPALWGQTESVVYSFTSGGKGYNPSGNLTLGSDGNFYGTTFENGADSTFPCSNNGGCGIVFKVTPAGALTVLHTFTNQNGDGANPTGGLVQGSDGNPGTRSRAAAILAPTVSARALAAASSLRSHPGAPTPPSTTLPGRRMMEHAHAR